MYHRPSTAVVGELMPSLSSRSLRYINMKIGMSCPASEDRAATQYDQTRAQSIYGLQNREVRAQIRRGRVYMRTPLGFSRHCAGCTSI